MGRYRLSAPAKADIAALLQASEAMHGLAARARYLGLLAAALRRVAALPTEPPAADRSDLIGNLRSYHIRHSRARNHEEPVGQPVHIVFYRMVAPGVVDVVRVLHERMDPRRHVSLIGN